VGVEVRIRERSKDKVSSRKEIGGAGTKKEIIEGGDQNQQE